MSGETLIKARLPSFDSLQYVEEWGGVMYITTLYGVYVIDPDGELELIDIFTGGQVAS
jgi:hypothetical protein